MFSLTPRPSLLLLLLLALPLSLSACGSPPASGTPTSNPPALVKGEFVGDAGTLAGIGLSTDGQQVIAYLCDGTTQHVGLAEWFKGSVTTTGIDLTNAHGAHLVATLTAQAITGTVTLQDGRSSPFTAHLLPTPGSDYGLFRSEQTFNGVSYVGGWIIHQQGVASAPVHGGAFSAEALRPLPTCCVPDSRDRGGIINEHTGALIVTPDFDGDSATVPNLGTFRLTPCRQGQC